MLRNFVPNNPVAQFFYTVFVSIIIFFAFWLLSMPIAYWCFGPIAFDLSRLSNVNDPSVLSVIKFYQLVQSIGLFVIPPFVLAYLYSDTDVKSYLCFHKSINVRQIILAILIILSIMPLINLLADYNSQIRFPESWAPLERSLKEAEQSAENTTMAFMNTRTIGGLLFNIFMVAIIPALGEELMFRGVIQRIFTNLTHNVHLGILMSSFLFTAMHFQFYGLFPRWILGMVFGYLLVWSGSMWAPILAHFINNSIAVIGYFMVNRGNLGKESLEVGSTADLLPFTFMSTLVFFIACYYFYQQTKPRDVIQ
jgi:membrane protease YdiL (CAAX protease family)